MIKVPISKHVYEKYYLFKPKYGGEPISSHNVKTDEEILPKDIYANYRPTGMFEILGELDFENAKHVKNIIINGKLYDVIFVYDCSNLTFRIIPWIPKSECTIIVNKESYEKALKEKEEYYNSKLLDNSKHDDIYGYESYKECMTPPQQQVIE